MKRKLAVITGGTSGIGFSIAKNLALNFDLALAFRSNTDKATQAKSYLEQAFPDSRVQLYGGCLSSYETCSHFIEAVRNDFKVSPAILVNAAGRLSDALFVGSDFTLHQSLINEHLFVPMSLTHLLIEDMYKENFGRIINISSIATKIAKPGQVNYITAKSGLEGFTKALALEVAHRGITVNAIAPGLIDTPLSSHITNQLRSNPKSIRSMIPVGFVGSPDDVGPLAGFLCSEQARYITGEIFSVDGGRSLGVPK